MKTFSFLSVERLACAFVAFGGCLTLCSAVAVCQDDVSFQGVPDLPDVVRFRELPRRMYLEPEITIPPDTPYIQDSTLKLMERIVVSPPDNEILMEAIRSLQQIQTGGLVDVSHVGELLQGHLVKSDSDLVKQVCASALATIGRAEFAEDVARMCVPRHEALCLQIEPGFSIWGGDALKPVWTHRLNHSEEFSSSLTRLACDGLAQLQDVAVCGVLERLLSNKLADYSVRHAAARALGDLDHGRAAAVAVGYSNATVPDKLLACALLGQCQSESGFALLSRLCDDTSNAVASRGWEIVQALEPQRLAEKLERGVVHADSSVRLTAIQVVRELPTADRCDALHQLMADVHIGVRNSARLALRSLAKTAPALRGGIVKNAGDSLKAPTTTWQQLEQSLVILGELRHREWQDQCVRLLEHDRPEVFVSSAWLLHLMPHPEMAEDITRVTLRRHEMDRIEGRVEQLVFLLQHAGLTNAASLRPLCQKQFENKFTEHPEVRAAGLWALGKIHKGQTDSAVVAKLLERIFDDDPMFPEFMIVRRMSVLALVWMDARSTVPELVRVRKVYDTHEMLRETARWALPQLGAEQPPPLESVRRPVQNFPISPL